VNTAYGPEQLHNPALKAWKVRGAQALDALTARRVRRFHAVSTWVADTMARRLRVPRGRIDVVPRGRDPHRLGERSEPRRRAARAALGVTDDDFVVLAVGRHEHQKGYDVLLPAVATVRERAPGTKLFVAGRETAVTPALRARAAELGIDAAVRFLGIREDVPELLCGADVFAFASRWEGMPGGVIEAMALGTPIVATTIAPVREVLGEPPHALLVPPDDAGALADALLAVQRGAATLDTTAGRERFLTRFAIGAVAQEMVRFYERALSPRPVTARS
jgi:glycosyltransferase involved in cell wall biosynthesis